MSNLSDRMGKLTAKLAGKYGASAVITRTYPGTFDPSTQAEVSGGCHTDEVSAVIQEFRAHEINGETIRYGDKKILVPKSDLQNLVEPQPDDIIEVNDQKYRIVESRAISAGDKFVGFSIQARK